MKSSDDRKSNLSSERTEDYPDVDLGAGLELPPKVAPPGRSVPEVSQADAIVTESMNETSGLEGRGSTGTGIEVPGRHGMENESSRTKVYAPGGAEVLSHDDGKLASMPIKAGTPSRESTP